MPTSARKPISTPNSARRRRKAAPAPLSIVEAEQAAPAPVLAEGDIVKVTQPEPGFDRNAEFEVISVEESTDGLFAVLRIEDEEPLIAHVSILELVGKQTSLDLNLKNAPLRFSGEDEGVGLAIEAAADPLPQLAADINQLYSQAVEANQTAKQATRAELSLTKALGEKLLEAKALAGHGNWIPWVTANLAPGLGKGLRQLQTYMMLAQPDNWSALVADCGGSVERLSLSDAIARIKRLTQHIKPAAEPPLLDPAPPAAPAPMPERDDLIALYEQVGYVVGKAKGSGFAVERSDLGPPFPLAFPSVAVAWAYWQAEGEKLLGLAARKPKLKPLPVGTEVIDSHGLVGKVVSQDGEFTVINTPLENGNRSSRIPAAEVSKEYQPRVEIDREAISADITELIDPDTEVAAYVESLASDGKCSIVGVIDLLLPLCSEVQLEALAAEIVELIEDIS